MKIVVLDLFYYYNQKFARKESRINPRQTILMASIASRQSFRNVLVWCNSTGMGFPASSCTINTTLPAGRHFGTQFSTTFGGPAVCHKGCCRRPNDGWPTQTLVAVCQQGDQSSGSCGCVADHFPSCPHCAPPVGACASESGMKLPSSSAINPPAISARSGTPLPLQSMSQLSGRPF